MKNVSMSKQPSFGGLLALLAVCTFLTGCGGSGADQATVSGKVTYKGARVTGGSIHLHPVAGGSLEYPVPIKADGTYTVSGVPTGSYQVAIETETVKAMTGALQMPPGGPPPQAGDSKTAPPPQPSGDGRPKYVEIPKKYADPKTSGLTWDLKAGGPAKDFDLTD